eukprot:Phypoly_transcript_03986.p1 GENE.Phypoly_transcript_03986~~Phypoly_transcript_03986.p1  ORF type:complete len:741 (+),score=114.71 Phypoly_transcript_03986:43-2265(+)
MHKLFSELPKDVVHQGTLENAIRALFPNEYIKTNVKKETSVKNTDTDSFLEFDVWIPSMDLFLEFQDEYHYLNKWYSSAAVEKMKERDSMKKERVQSKGGSVVVVPCWWDGKKESLREMIIFQRPDLDDNSPKRVSLPTPLNPSFGFFEYGSIPDVGELMLASFPTTPMFALSISKDAPWWLGEKYDGVRACWNPAKRTLYSRTGLIFAPPPKFLSLFPPLFLDGEMWLGRSFFMDVQSLVKSTVADTNWTHLRVVIFDAPKPASAPFEKRYSAILAIPPAHPCIVLAPRILCKSPRQLHKSMAHVMKDGGEGVILRKINSVYAPGRSKFLWKIKAARADTEALVMHVNPLNFEVLLRLPNGTEFTVECKEEQHLKRGDVVTFAYDQFSTHAIPSNPEILRVREDVSWEDVLHDYQRENPSDTLYTSDFQKGESIKPLGYWTAEKFQNSKLFLEQFTRSRNMDPLVASSWYDAASDFMQLKEASSILAHQNGSFVKTLANIFPEINFDFSKFSVLKNKFWHDMKNRRNFFDKFARERGFDPLVPDNWYTSDKSAIRRIKGAQSILNYYNSSIVNALIHVYPDIGLKQEGFDRMPVGYWNSSHNQRNFFEKFASQKGFDPLLPENWYLVLKEDLLAFGAGALLGNFKGSYVRALVHVFPDLEFEPKKFADLDGKRRKWFLNFATKYDFDPLVPDNWYSKRAELMAAKKEMAPVLQHYRGKVRKALLHLFPSIGLSPKKIRF